MRKCRVQPAGNTYNNTAGMRMGYSFGKPMRLHGKNCIAATVPVGIGIRYERIRRNKAGECGVYGIKRKRYPCMSVFGGLLIAEGIHSASLAVKTLHIQLRNNASGIKQLALCKYSAVFRY